MCGVVVGRWLLVDPPLSRQTVINVRLTYIPMCARQTRHRLCVLMTWGSGRALNRGCGGTQRKTRDSAILQRTTSTQSAHSGEVDSSLRLNR